MTARLEPAVAAPTEQPLAPTRNPLKRLYRWVLSWAHHPLGTWALAVFAFLDSAIFPVPPLFLQVALSLEKPKRSWWYAFVDTAASVAGAVVGYYIGFALWEAVGIKIIGELKPDVRASIETSAFRFILVYSFLPFPYKVITIGSGFLHVPLATLLVASTVGRSLRFFSLAALCFFLGQRVRDFIEKYFNWVCLGIGLLVATVLLVMKVFLRQ